MDYLNTVELNIAGEKTWKFGSPLPVAMDDMRGVTVLSQFYVTGESLYSDKMVRIKCNLRFLQQIRKNGSEPQIYFDWP